MNPLMIKGRKSVHSQHILHQKWATCSHKVNRKVNFEANFKVENLLLLVSSNSSYIVINSVNTLLNQPSKQFIPSKQVNVLHFLNILQLLWSLRIVPRKNSQVTPRNLHMNQYLMTQ